MDHPEKIADISRTTNDKVSIMYINVVQFNHNSCFENISLFKNHLLRVNINVSNIKNSNIITADFV